MNTNAFTNGNENPQWTIQDSYGRFWFSPGIQVRDLRFNLFQGHHINPNELLSLGELRELWKGLGAWQGADPSTDINPRYVQNDARFNQVWLPTGRDSGNQLSQDRFNARVLDAPVHAAGLNGALEQA